MHCNFDEKLLHLYIDGELNSQTRQRVAEHVGGCRVCSQAIEALLLIQKQTSESVKALKAPESLRLRILDSLATETNPGRTRFGFLEKIRLSLSNLKPAGLYAFGAVAAIIMIVFLMPSESNLHKMAPTLAKGYFNEKALDGWYFVSTVPSEVKTYFADNYGFDVEVPVELDGNAKLKCGCLAYIDKKPVMHASYKKDDMLYTLYIFRSGDIKSHESNFVKISDREYVMESKDDVNMVCWYNGDYTYILAGCCPHDKLVGMSLASL